MTSRERFAAALAHRPPDRVPFDIGGTPLTGMRPRCKERLCALLGFPAPAPENDSEERLRQWAGTDFRCVGDIVHLPSPHTRRISDAENVDSWGIRRARIDGEWQITGYPLRDASVADLRRFAWPEPRVDEGTLARWQAEARRLHAEGRHVVVASHPVFGILELGCWMCGYDDFLLKMAADPDFVRLFFDRFLAIQLAVCDQYYAALGPYIDLTTSGDDFGMQAGPLVSPETFGTLIAPYFAERIRHTKAVARCRYWHHSCGSVARLLDQLIACGVDILNPIQTSAAEMEPAELKRRFGSRIVFWGGMDVQQFLPFAKPAEVAARARELVQVLGRDGGYILAPAHEMQDDIPAENIAAWVEATRKMG
jgi:uroporphyrinogen decarboxylase